MGKIAQVMNSWRQEGKNKVTFDDAEAARESLMNDSWKWYEGRQQDPLDVEPGEPDDNVSYDLVPTIVDTITDWVTGSSIVITLGEESNVEDEQDASDDEAWLAETWPTDEIMTWFTELRQNGGNTGHAFSWTSYDEWDEIVTTVIPTSEVRVIRAPGRRREAQAYIVRLGEGRDGEGLKCWRRKVVARSVAPALIPGQRRTKDEALSWTITDQVTYKEPKASSEWFAEGDLRWEVELTANDLGELVPAVEVWPYPLPPIEDNQNKESSRSYYGRPDHTRRQLQLSAAVDRNASRDQRIHRHTANPINQIIGLGPGQDIGESEDGDLIMPLGSEIKRLDPPKLENGASVTDRQLEAYHKAVRVPEIAHGGVEGISTDSSVALTVLHSPLIKMADKMRLIYVRHIKGVLRRRLMLAGRDWHQQVNVRLDPMLPVNEEARARVAQVMKALGFSMETIIGYLGYDAAQELQRIENERKEAEARNVANQQEQPAVPDAEGEAAEGEEGDEPLGDTPPQLRAA